MSKSDLTHIIRPQLPWRTEPSKTECGRDPGAVSAWEDLDSFRARLRAEGQQRAALTTCMNCLSRASTGARVREDWEHRPSAVMAREISGLGWGPDKEHLIDRELRVIGMLVNAHREEFDDLLKQLESTVSLGEARRRKRKAGS